MLTLYYFYYLLFYVYYSRSHHKHHLLNQDSRQGSKTSNPSFTKQPQKETCSCTCATSSACNDVRPSLSKNVISRQAPGMRDVVIVRERGVKKDTETLFTMSLLKAYRCFKSEHAETLIGKSKFADLRPCHVLWCPDTPRNVCLCGYHENMKLALDCVQHVIQRQAFQSTQDFIKAVVCSPDINKYNCFRS